jgi:lipopolysaccharide export system permease protein
VTTPVSPWFGRFSIMAARAVALHLAIALLAGVVLFLIIDLVEITNLASEVGGAELARISWLNLPRVLRTFLPVAAPIGAATAIGALVRRREVEAMLAAGAAPSVVLKPTAVVAVLAALAFAANQEWLVPPSAGEVGALRRRLGLGAGPLETAGPRQSWFRGGDWLYRVESLDGGGALMLRIDEGRIAERIDAEALRFVDGAWIGAGVVARRFSPDGTLTTSTTAQRVLPIRDAPRDLAAGLIAPERLPLVSLADTTTRRAELGRPVFAHRLELHRRLAQPLVVIMAMLLGGAAALRLGRRQTPAQALGVGAAIGAAVWVSSELSALVGASGAVSAITSAYGMPLLFAAAALLAARSLWRHGVAELTRSPASEAPRQ